MRQSVILVLTTFFLSGALASQAADVTAVPMLSFQGSTGIINTPSAHVSNEGTIHLNYTNQRESAWRNDQKKGQDNYLVSLGVFSFLEIGGRVTEAPGRARDLSAAFKITSAPLTRDMPFMPVLAGGIQDVGGGAVLLQNRYLVMSEDLWRFRLSLGYSFGPDTTKGGFGGVEFRAHDWVTLLGEYDSNRDVNAAIRLLSPEIWMTPIQLTTTLKSTLNHKPENIDVAVGMTFPLDFKKRSRPADTSSTAEASTPESAPAMSPAQPGRSDAAVVATVPVPEKSRDVLDTLYRRLEKVGFTNLRVGLRNEKELVVEYENTIFNHNELDALGVVAGIACMTAPERFEVVHIAIRRNNIAMAVVSAPLAVLRTYISRGGDTVALKDAVRFSYDTAVIEGTEYHARTSPYYFPTTSLILAPGLTSFVATEAGVFDYLLSFKPEIVANLWKGGVYQARWDIPVAWSENFNNNHVYRSSRQNTRMDRNMLFQGVRVAPGLMANLGAGMVLHDIYGTLNEVVWTPGQGNHRLRGAQAWARNSETHKTTTVYLGSYRYFIAPLDLSLEATGGRFWGQDKGFTLELKRFFGDTSVSTFYKNSTSEDNKHWQAAGIQLVFPLTPRKDLKVGPVLVRGADEWGYALETTLAIGGQKSNNVLSQSLGINPQPTAALYRSYYNRDRLGGDYIKQHIERLREAWLKYRTAADMPDSDFK